MKSSSSSIVKFYGNLAIVLNSLQSIFLLAIRLFWGWQFLIAGLGKFLNFSNTSDFFFTLGIPFPTLSTFLAASSEFVGGLFLFLGLFSRVITIPLVFTMIVAFLTAHQEAVLTIFSNVDNFFAQGPFLFLFVSIIVMLFGPGKYSIDYFLFKERM